MDQLSNINFREAQNKAELEALFTLRHQVYSEDENLKSMLSENSLDLNVYDLNALHFGAFENNEPIAYIRLVVGKETHFTSWVKELFSEHGIKLETQKFTFPFQNYHPDLIWSKKFIQSLENRKIGEVGRLAIHKDYRQAGEILDTLFENFINYCKNQGINTAFGSCTLLLERYYRKFNFQRAENCEPFIYKNLPEAVIVRFDD